MGALCSGKRHWLDSKGGGSGGTDLDSNTLLAHQLDARLSVLPPTPVAPEDGERPNDEGMQENAHLARFGSGATIPLTLLA